MSGWKDWAIGEVVTESEFQSFVQDQVVQVYDDATDRDNTLGANVAEGMVCYLKDTDETQVYDSTNWVQVGQGTITEVVAGTALTGGGSSGSVTLNVDESEITLAQSQVTDLETDLSNKASTTHATTHESGGTDEIEIAQSQVTGLDAGTEGFTALSNGSSGLSYQPVSHNYIINGAFDIWQRGDSFTSSGYTADRWKDESSATTRSITKESFTPNDIEAIGYGEGEYYLRHVRSGGNFARLHQFIEDVRTLAGQTVTLSFWARVGSGTLTNTIRINQNFGSGGSTSVTNGFSDVTLTTSWQRFVRTTTLSSISGKTIGAGSNLNLLVIRQVDTTGHTIDLWGVQLEAGSIATPFKRNANSIAGELAACQRYYFRHSSSDNPSGFVVYGTGPQFSSTQCLVDFTFPVTMRATPTGSISGSFQTLGNATLSAVPSISRASTKNASILAVVTGGTVGDSVMLRDDNDQTAYLELSAEL